MGDVFEIPVLKARHLIARRSVSSHRLAYGASCPTSYLRCYMRMHRVLVIRESDSFAISRFLYYSKSSPHQSSIAFYKTLA